MYVLGIKLFNSKILDIILLLLNWRGWEIFFLTNKKIIKFLKIRRKWKFYLLDLEIKNRRNKFFFSNFKKYILNMFIFIIW